MRRRPLALVAVAGAAAAASLLGGARPAAADPPQPTEYRSSVTGVSPATDAVEAEVVGGDAFLEVTVARGHDAAVAGYGGEPYLRFLPDGTVERNARSEATYLNEDRYGAGELPAAADNDAEPEWETVASGGSYAWHDHRIHWMGTSAPPGARPGDVVQTWTVGLTVDGAATTVEGRLVMEAGVSPVPWIVLALAALAAVVAAGRRRAQPAAAAASLVGALAALVGGWGQYSIAPAGSGADPLLVAVPAVALVAAVVALATAVRGRARALPGVATLASCAALLGWAVLRADVLWLPVLPTALPAAVDRAATALALGLAVGAAGIVVWSGGLATGRAVRPAPESADPA